jgi:hypothetical protein
MNFADQEEIAERQKNRKKKKQNNQFWDILTVIFIIASIFAVVYFAIVFTDPTSSLNPYPPPTLPAIIQLPTSTATPVSLPPTWTPTVTITPVPTITPFVATPAMDTPVGSTLTPIATADASAKYPFMSIGDPTAVANTIFHPDKDCNWQGIAGQVWDIQGRPLIGYRIHLQGYYNGGHVEYNTLSGGAQEWYGESGYEFVLSNKPIDTTGKLTLQLEDQSFMAISNLVTINTYADCQKNLILVNFQQVK